MKLNEHEDAREIMTKMENILRNKLFHSMKKLCAIPSVVK